MTVLVAHSLRMRRHPLRWIVGTLLFLLSSTLLTVSAAPKTAVAAPLPHRQLNAPYFPGDKVLFDEMAIAWFGQVTPTDNYADIRIGYNNDHIRIRVAAIDRNLWYDKTLKNTPNPALLNQSDAATIYLDVGQAGGSQLSSNDYRVTAQLNWFEDRANYHALFQGSGNSWNVLAQPITSESGFRGNVPANNDPDRGWFVDMEIPFASLGLSGPPADGTSWGMAVTLHDQDAEGTAVTNTHWPENSSGQTPSSWATLHFGQPDYAPPPASNPQTVTIRHNLNGTQVTDAQVGGDSVCGNQFHPNFFDGWGDANYAGSTVLNVQNQIDLADFPCFSKTYLTFPTDLIPDGKVLISATLTLHQFGGSDPSRAKPSLIQVMTINEGWNEATITWNNAPLAVENIASTWVDPTAFPGWPGIPASWDVSRGVAEAIEQGEPVRLALYGADSGYHSGKYFVSSETGEWNAVARPTLEVTYGDPGFVAFATPGAQKVGAGETAVFTINLQRGSGFTDPITIAAGNPAPSLLDLSLGQTTLSGTSSSTTLTVIDQHGSGFTDGAIYTIPITLTSGGITKTTQVTLLINGEQLFIPLIEQ